MFKSKNVQIKKYSNLIIFEFRESSKIEKSSNFENLCGVRDAIMQDKTYTESGYFANPQNSCTSLWLSEIHRLPRNILSQKQTKTWFFIDSQAIVRWFATAKKEQAGSPQA
jgi:hypothetical protein